MLSGGAIVRFGISLRGKDLRNVWAHLVYEMEGSVSYMEMWELSTGAVLLEVEYEVEARTEKKYHELLEERKEALEELLGVIMQQRVGVVDFMKYSPVPSGRKRVGQMRPKKT